MRDFFSASELAGLPGMPEYAQSVTRMAERESWSRRKRAGRGGGWEYHIASLPEPARAYLAAQAISAAKATNPAAQAGAIAGRRLALAATIDTHVAQRAREEGLARAATLQGGARQRMDAKLALLAALDLYTQTAQLSASKAVHAFCTRYNEGAIQVEDWVRDIIPDVHPATVYRWRGALQQEGAARLAGRYGNRKGSSKIDSQPALREFVVAMLTDHPHVSTAHILEAVRTRFTGIIALPSASSLERWLARWRRENAQLLTAVANPDAWKNRYMVAFGSASEDVTGLNQRWELDSTPGDVELVDGRYSIIGVIDVYSRRGKLLLAKTSTAATIALLVRRAMLEWGVPQQIKSDNGQDYKSLHLQRVYKSLDIEPLYCTPFSAWEKPHIERFLGTFNHDLVELLPNYIGHSVAERKELEARKSFADRLMKRGEALPVRMTAAEFQHFMDQWVDNLYHHRPHDGLAERAPFQVAAAWTAPIKRIDNERALDVLLAEAPGNNGMRTVTKKGIRVDDFTYVAPELGEHVSQRVHVRYAEDLGRIYVFNDAGFICIAEDPTVTGVSRREVAAHARERQKAKVQEARQQLKASARKANTKEIAHEILAAKLQANNVTLLPKPGVAHTTAALDAAADAAKAQDGTPAPDLTRAKEQARAKLQAQPASVHQLPETAKQRYQRWLEVDRRVQAGAAVSEQEQRFWEGFQQTPDWRAQRLVHEGFGGAAREQAAK